MATVTIDKKSYELDSLSETAKKQLQNLTFCDQKIQQLQNELAIAQTARATYSRALSDELPKDAEADKAKAKK